jgi:hypothetical protein
MHKSRTEQQCSASARIDQEGSEMQTISRGEAGSLMSAANAIGDPGRTSEIERLDQMFFGSCGGNIAHYAIQTKQTSGEAAKQLRSISSVDARDPRYLGSILEGDKSATDRVRKSSEILGDFKKFMTSLEEQGIPREKRARYAAARKLATSSATTPSHVAIISDSIAKDLYDSGDTHRSYSFGLLSAQAVNRCVSMGPRTRSSGAAAKAGVAR